MGTSSSYNGPNKSPLLPPDFEFDDLEIEINVSEEDDVESDAEVQENDSDKTESESIEKDKEEIVSWQSAKSSMTRFVKSSSQTPDRAISNYVKANGGSKNLAKSAKGGIRSAVALGTFGQNVINSSFKEALKNLGFDWTDKSAKEILGLLVEKLSPNPNLKEDSVARKAMTETMIDFYNELEEDQGIDSFENLEKSQFDMLTTNYIIHYIYERIISELGKRFEESAENHEAAVKKEKEVKNYITAKVETSDKLKGIMSITFSDSAIISFIAAIYIECYSLLENI